MEIFCEQCQVRQATVHILDILCEDGPKKLHLCEKCFQGQDAPADAAAITNQPFPDLFLQIMTHKAGRTGAQRCPECGITLRDFRSKGRFGCPKDYEVFASHIEGMLEKMHNATQHVGRAPGDSGLEQARRERDSLRDRLQRSIQAEDYEEAARLRDRLQELEQRIAEISSGEGSNA